MIGMIAIGGKVRLIVGDHSLVKVASNRGIKGFLSSKGGTGRCRYWKGTIK
jgi:hypothetical protein